MTREMREREREKLPIDMVREALWDGIMREGGLRRKSCAQRTLDPRSLLLPKGLHHSKAPSSASCSNIISSKAKVNHPHYSLTAIHHQQKTHCCKSKGCMRLFDAPLMKYINIHGHAMARSSELQDDIIEVKDSRIWPSSRLDFII